MPKYRITTTSQQRNTYVIEADTHSAAREKLMDMIEHDEYMPEPIDMTFSEEEIDHIVELAANERT